MTSVVQTTSGPVQGFVDTHPLSETSTSGLSANTEAPVQKYLGIPYGCAARWAQASPPKRSTEVLKCVEFGPACPQPAGLLTPMISKASPGIYPRQHIGQSESDLFTLNIFASENVKEGDNVPVMAWIHGGSWKDGATSNLLYDPTNVIRHAKTPVIIVTINYRVNLFGFFGSKDLIDENGLVGNYGLRDQLLALKWINQNISRFGGDKTNVTIYGESAGACSVGWHVGGKDALFRRAILQSGAASTMGYQALDKHEKGWHSLLTHFKIDVNDPDRVQKAREITTGDLLGYLEANPTLSWSACIESGPHAIWASHPDVRIAKGEYPDSLESVMLGCCTDEGTMFTQFFGMTKSQEKVDSFLSAFGDAKRYIHSLYPGIEDVKSHQGGMIDHPVSKFLHDAIFDGPVRFLADTLISTTNVKTGKSPKVYLYQSNVLLPAWESFKWGAHHFSEIPYVFHSSSLWNNDLSSDEEKTANLFGRYWLQFSAQGEPSLDWPAYSQQEKKRLIFENGGKDRLEDVSEGQSEMALQLFSQVIKHRWGIEEKDKTASTKL